MSGVVKIGIAASIAAALFVGASLFLMETEPPTIARVQPTRVVGPETESTPGAPETIVEVDRPEIVIATAPEEPIEAETPETPDPPTEISENPLNLRGILVDRMAFENIHIARLLEDLGELYDIKFQLDTRSIGVPQYAKPEDAPQVQVPATGITPPPYVTDGMLENVRFTDATMLDALNELAGALGLAVVSEPGYIWISTQELIDHEAHWEPESRFDVYKNEDRLLETVTTSFEDIHLGDVLEIFADNYKITIA